MMSEVFVTVGTTKFEGLVAAFNTDAVASALKARGFSRVTLQIGHGETEPREHDGMEVDWYRLKPSIAEDMSRAQLIISHAGAGSIVESLRLEKKLVVVVNTALMDNHQLELAQALADRHHVVATTSENLARDIEEADLDGLRLYPEPDRRLIPRLLDDVVFGENKDGS